MVSVCSRNIFLSIAQSIKFKLFLLSIEFMNAQYGLDSMQKVNACSENAGFFLKNVNVTLHFISVSQLQCRLEVLSEAN